MQHANVVIPGDGGRIGGGEIVGGFLVPEALAVQDHAQRVEGEGLRFLRRETTHVVRQLELARHLAFGVVIAEKHENRNAGAPEATHLATEEDAGVVIAPAAIVEIAGNHHEINLLLDGTVDQLAKGVPCRVAQLRGRCIGISGESGERTVEVDVGGVNEAHRGNQGLGLADSIKHFDACFTCVVLDRESEGFRDPCVSIWASADPPRLGA